VEINVHVVLIKGLNVVSQNTDHVRIKRIKRDAPEFLKLNILCPLRDMHATLILKGGMTVPGVPLEVTSVDQE